MLQTLRHGPAIANGKGKDVQASLKAAEISRRTTTGPGLRNFRRRDSRDASWKSRDSQSGFRNFDFFDGHVINSRTVKFVCLRFKEVAKNWFKSFILAKHG